MVVVVVMVLLMVVCHVHIDVVVLKWTYVKNVLKLSGVSNIELKKICLLCVFVPLLLNKMDHILIHLNLGRVK